MARRSIPSTSYSLNSPQKSPDVVTLSVMALLLIVGVFLLKGFALMLVAGIFFHAGIINHTLPFWPATASAFLLTLALGLTTVSKSK